MKANSQCCTHLPQNPFLKQMSSSLVTYEAVCQYMTHIGCVTNIGAFKVITCV
jgi:hypothetical protein